LIELSFFSNLKEERDKLIEYIKYLTPSKIKKFILIISMCRTMRTRFMRNI